jgi:hypothetical protein
LIDGVNYLEVSPGEWWNAADIFANGDEAVDKYMDKSKIVDKRVFINKKSSTFNLSSDREKLERSISESYKLLDRLNKSRSFDDTMYILNEISCNDDIGRIVNTGLKSLNQTYKFTQIVLLSRKHR